MPSLQKRMSEVVEDVERRKGRSTQTDWVEGGNVLQAKLDHRRRRAQAWLEHQSNPNWEMQGTPVVQRWYNLWGWEQVGQTIIQFHYTGYLDITHWLLKEEGIELCPYDRSHPLWKAAGGAPQATKWANIMPWAVPNSCGIGHRGNEVETSTIFHFNKYVLNDASTLIFYS